MLLVSLIPTILCYCLEVILSEDGFGHIRRSKIVVIAATLISYAAGMLLGKSPVLHRKSPATPLFCHEIYLIILRWFSGDI